MNHSVEQSVEKLPNRTATLTLLLTLTLTLIWWWSDLVVLLSLLCMTMCPVTEQLRTAAENLSCWTVMNTTLGLSAIQEANYKMRKCESAEVRK